MESAKSGSEMTTERRLNVVAGIDADGAVGCLDGRDGPHVRGNAAAALRMTKMHGLPR